jgi:predicted aspartyl protease
MHTLKQTISLALAACLILGGPCRAGNSEFGAGVSAYGAKDYNGALNHFENAIKLNPYDCNAIYYKAVVLTQLGKGDQAQIQYAILIKNFSTTPAAKNAEAALAIINPRYLRQLKPQSATPAPASAASTVQPPSSAGESEQSMRNADTDVASLPKQSRIYFERDGKNLSIDASINGRPIKMLFDSGAENVALGKNHLAQLGIRPPETAPVGHAYGVGDSGAQQIWAMRVTLKVGDIERKNFPISVQEDMPTKPLLGQTFFKAFQVEVDNGAKTITFIKKEGNATASERDPNVIPFSREGNEIVVQVEVNGKTVPMYLDTGAEQIYFTAEQARSAGLEIPDDAQAGMTQGIAGKTAVKSFVVPRMKCGPIIKNDVMVVVAQPSAESDSDAASTSGHTKGRKEGLRHPLLGQEFFGDFRITVDSQANVIRMRR